MSDAPDPKALLRRTAFDARKRAFEGAEAAVAQATARLLTGSATAEGASSRATCRSARRSIRSGDGALHGAGARLCVPVIAGAGQPLDFREWTPDCTLVEGPFKAMVPETGPGSRPIR
jgi:5-formyltetrahydrofolate cyclo-ligase